MGHAGKLIITAAVLSLISVYWIGEMERSILYERAETLAIKMYGDKKAPLTNEERAEWHKAMNVREYMSKSHLEKFLKENNIMKK